MAVVTRICLIFLLPLAARGGTSADYSISPTVLDGGGVAGSSAAYSVNPATAAGAAGASLNYAVRSGYAGQLLDRVSISIDEPSSPMTLNERAALQLAVTEFHDDSTRGILAVESVSWSVQSGPLASINSTGLATAGSIYQNTVAVGRAAIGSLSDTVSLSVINTGLDDFAPYATDGLPDGWQVRYFGLNGTQASIASDADFDSLSNLQEYAFGTDPLQASGAAVQWSGSTFLSAGVPVPHATTVNGSFSYRAVFSRRKDYNTVGLSYAVEFSADLATWKASTTTPIRLADHGEIEAVYVPYLIFVNGKKAKFFRVKVQSQ
jgi:hypothetical protein